MLNFVPSEYTTKDKLELPSKLLQIFELPLLHPKIPAWQQQNLA